jgi:hypothetical protein
MYMGDRKTPRVGIVRRHFETSRTTNLQIRASDGQDA